MTGDRVSLPVSEIFTTVQGEGPSLGRLAGFVRLMGCNLACTWCDTPYTWDASRYDLRAQGRRMPVDDIAVGALVGGARLVVITGGEPLLHRHTAGWARLLQTLQAAGVEVEVETNGTLPPTDDPVTRYVASPKLSHAGGDATTRLQSGALAAFTELAQGGRAVFKFVAGSRRDVVEAAGMCREWGFPAGSVWVMPLGATAVEVLGRTRAVTEAAIEHGFHVTTRLQVLTWGEERGH